MEPAGGEKLKKIRLEKGISLEEVQKKTKIHLNILKAIEGDGLTDLSPVYLKGFIKIYCKFLGLDPKDYIPGYKEVKTVVIESQVKDKETADASLKPAPVLKTAIANLDFSRILARIKPAAIGIGIIILAWIVLFNFGKFISSRHKAGLARKQARAAAVDTKKAQTSQKAKPASTPQKSQVTQAALPLKENISGIRLVLKTREKCWISLKADGKLVFQRVLEKGRSESWQAKNKIELSLGNAGVVDLEVNGRSFSNLGRKGQKLSGIIITKEGLDIPR